MRVGFVGAGKVGCSLGKYLAEQKTQVSGYYSKSPQSARDAAEFTKSNAFETLEAVIEESDILFLTVPDGQIAPVWEKIKKYPIHGKMICHCSGSLSSKIFYDIEKTGATGFSIHPLLAVSNRHESYSEIPKALFTIEGSPQGIEAMEAFCREKNLQVQRIAADVKTRYHGAAVMASNLVLGLLACAQSELEQCGFTQENAKKALEPLVTGNVERYLQTSAHDALTGPIERADVQTVERHLHTFRDLHARIYRDLSLEVLEIAKGKHPQRDYHQLYEILEEK